MQSHILRLVYDGLGATRHEMPARFEKQITAGAQEFLGAHAYFLTEGRIPKHVADHSEYSQIYDVRQRNGSWETIFTIGIAGLFFKKYFEELIDGVTVDAAAATKLVFRYLVRSSYKAWQQRRPMTDRTFDRIEPVFVAFTGNRTPIVDIEVEREMQRRLLFQRTNSSMKRITAPLGRAAAHVDIWLDDQRLDHLESRFISEDDNRCGSSSISQDVGRSKDVSRLSWDCVASLNWGSKCRYRLFHLGERQFQGFRSCDSDSCDFCDRSRCEN